MEHQDWNTVTISGSALRKRAMPSQEEGRKPVQLTHMAASLRKVELADDVQPPKKILSIASRNAISQARTAKGLTQVQLNTTCGFPQHTIRDIEAGKLIPTPPQLQSLRNVLQISLQLSDAPAK